MAAPKFTPPMDEFPPLSMNPPVQAIDTPATKPVVGSLEVAVVDQPTAINSTLLKPASVLVPSTVKIRK
jgi:hypothetical protein